MENESMARSVCEMREHKTRAMERMQSEGCCGETEYLTPSTGRCWLCIWCPKRVQELKASST